MFGLYRGGSDIYRHCKVQKRQGTQLFQTCSSSRLETPGARRGGIKFVGVDGWIILGWIFRRWDVGIWTGLGWPRIGTGGGRL